MNLSALTAISPLDGRYEAKLTELRHLVSEYGLIYFRVVIEIEWLITLSNASEIPELNPLTENQLDALRGIITHFSIEDALEIKAIEKTTNHDVKAVEYFIRDKTKDLTTLLPFIHFACTSEDINNLAYALMLKNTREQVLQPRIKTIIENLSVQANAHQSLPMLSRTHGQTASPTTLGKEFANVIARAKRQFQQLSQQTLLGKFNGAVGNYNAHHAAYPNIDWPAFNKKFVEGLGLEFNPMTTQIEPHDYIAEFLQTLSRLNTIFLDLSRDMWSYISLGYFQQDTKAGEVGSSTMPHKVNPIDFENAEGNFGLANAFNEHLALKLPVSRWQRDLSDSTVLRNLGSAMAYSVLAYKALEKGLTKVSANENQIQQDLEQRPEVLAEAIQTVMRRFGAVDAYEQLKELTRGRAITLTLLREFIEQTDLPKGAKNDLLALTPSSYLGFSAQLAQKGL